MRTKPTPGRWRTGDGGDRVIYAGLQPIGSAYLMDDSKVPYAVQKANAELMAAAPELLAALKDTLWGVETYAKTTGINLEEAAPVYFDHMKRVRDILTRLGELAPSCMNLDSPAMDALEASLTPDQ